MLKVTAAILTHQGRKRQNNEDYATHFKPDGEDLHTSGYLYIVADGVGGASQGERASQYAAEKVLYDYYLQPNIDPADRLRQIMEKVNNEIFVYSTQSDPPIRMATTMVAAVIRNDQLILANVGDSRGYLIHQGVAEQITRDHSLVGEMVRDGSLTEEEAMHSKVKNKLTRSLGGEPDVHVDVRANIQLQPGDKILLCSDGLTRYALAQDIVELTKSGTPEEITSRLIDYANRHGGADNITVAFIEIGENIPAVPTRVGQALPAPVDWEHVKTDPLISSRRLPRLRYNRRKQNIIFGSGVIIIVILCICLAFGTKAVINSINSNKTQTGTYSPVITTTTTPSSSKVSTFTSEVTSISVKKTPEPSHPSIPVNQLETLVPFTNLCSISRNPIFYRR